MTPEEARRQFAAADAEIAAAYWAFTRCRRALPPVLVVPDAYRRRREALAALFPHRAVSPPAS